MKKTLLSLGLLGLALQGYAQGWPAPRFAQVNPAATSSTPPDFIVEYISTVDANTAWMTMYDANGSGTTTASGARTTSDPVLGENFEYFPIASRQNPTFNTSNIAGVNRDIAVASTFGQSGGGEVVRTTNGGLSWTRATAATQFAAPDGFNNFVHMFDANNGVAFGDPNGGSYEILLTSDGGATWTRNTSAGMTPTVSGEYGLTRAFAAYGSTIWAAAGVQANSTAGTPGGISRVFKNTDYGRGAWTAVTVPNFQGPATDMAFYDANHGIAFNYVVTGGAISGVQRAVTSDGGTTWNTTLLSAPDSTASGRFYFGGVDAAQGRFISYGRSKFVPSYNWSFGYSTSFDGITWTDVQTGGLFTAMDVLDATGEGYGGYRTNSTNGSGGIFKTAIAPGGVVANRIIGGALDGVAFIPLSTRSAKLQSDLSVYPNPSADGNFTLRLNSGVKAGSQVVVYDAVGRQVYNRTLNGTAVNAQSVAIDLSQQKTGIYTLELRTAEGTAQQKLVVQ